MHLMGRPSVVGPSSSLSPAAVLGQPRHACLRKHTCTQFRRGEVLLVTILKSHCVCRISSSSAASMNPVSRRDRQALEQLLPLLDREITVDPEQQNPARRAARRQDVACARVLFNEERRAQEARKDSELRARLDSEYCEFEMHLLQSLTDPKGTAICSPQGTSSRVDKPVDTTVQHRLRSNFALGPIPPVLSTTISTVATSREPLRTLLSKFVTSTPFRPCLTTSARSQRSQCNKHSGPAPC